MIFYLLYYTQKVKCQLFVACQSLSKLAMKSRGCPLSKKEKNRYNEKDSLSQKRKKERKMFRLEWLFLMQIFMGILMIFFLRKLTQMKKQVDEITKEVTNYISYITEEMEDVEAAVSERESMPKEQNIRKEQGKSAREESQNHLIQAVLQEYFP